MRSGSLSRAAAHGRGKGVAPAGKRSPSLWRVEQMRRTLKRDSQILFRHERKRYRGYVLEVHQEDLLVRFQQRRLDAAACVARVAFTDIVRVLRP
jgi:hypothetical protein